MSLNVSPAQIVEESNSPLLAIADGWARIQLGEVADIINGFPFPSKGFNASGTGEPVIRIRDVGKTEPSTWFQGNAIDAPRVSHGEIVVGMDGDFRVARWVGPTALLNQRVCSIRVRKPDVMDERFLLLVLPGYLDTINEHTSSITVKHLSSRTVSDIPLPLPSLDEQRRIVEIIEKQFSRLDASDAVLDQCSRKIVRAQANPVGRAANLEQWEWAELGTVAEIQGGIQKQPKRRPQRNRYPFLRVANVGRRELDLADVHEIELFGNEIERYRLQSGDLLVVEGNGSPSQIGRSAIWQANIKDCVHQNHLIRVRAGLGLKPRFLEWFWNIPETSNALSSLASSTSGLYTLSVGKLARLKVPVPPLDIQQELLDSVESRRQMLNRVNLQIQFAIRKSKRLRLAIFERAFRGEFTS